MYWYYHALKNYFNFSDRASRTQYWFFSLMNLIVFIVAARLDNIFGWNMGDDFIYGPAWLILTLLMLIPMYAILARRLHDTGRSGWWILIGFVPIIGAIILFVFTLLPGSKGTNEYGPEPELPYEQSSQDNVISLHIIVLLIYTFQSFFCRTLSNFTNCGSEYYSELITILYMLIWPAMTLAFAFVIKNRGMRIALFIFTGIIILYDVWELVDYIRDLVLDY